MSHERRQTALGCLFLAIGVLLILLAVSPVVLGLLSTPRVHGDVSLVLLGLAIGLALLGALLIPFSGAGPAVQQFFTVVGPYVPRLGGSRAGDPQPPQPPPPLPPDGPR